MLKKYSRLLVVLGLMVLFSLCSYVYAQEIESQCKGCGIQTLGLTCDQIEKLLDYSGSFDITTDEIEELLGPDDSPNLTSDNSKTVLASHKKPKYKAIAYIKSDQTDLKYTEKDINISEGISITIEIQCPGPSPNEVQPMRLKKARNGAILTVEVTFDGPCYLAWNSEFGSYSSISHSREKLTNCHLIIKIYKELPQKKRNRYR
jgi:hypothetical protein